MARETRIRMERSVCTADGTAYDVGGVYDLPAALAKSWVAYGVCVEAADAELRAGLEEDEAVDEVRTVGPDPVGADAES